jgi:hypothetical protein
MPDESKERDLAALWKDQPVETLAVNLENLRSRRARELYSSTRWEVVGSIAAALFLAGVVAWRFAGLSDRAQQIGLAAVIAWVAISSYWFRKRIWREAPPAEAALAATGLEYYRRELERRRDHLRNAWLWHGPLALACLMLIAVLLGKSYMGVERLWKALPLLVLLGIWTGFGWNRRRRMADEIQREIEELERLKAA